MKQEVIEEFGQRIGLPGLALNERGMAGLSIEGLGDFTLEPAEGADYGDEDDVVLSLALEADASEAGGRFLAAMKRANWREAPAPAFRAGLLHDRLVLSVRIPADEASAVRLENALRFLLEEAGKR